LYIQSVLNPPFSTDLTFASNNLTFDSSISFDT
jgi:hypothetical protein